MPLLSRVRAVTFLIPAEAGPRRTFALATLVNASGNGLMLVSLPLYLTQIVDLSAAQVGVGLTLAAAVTLLVNLPVGHLADRRGSLQIVKAMLLLQGAATLALIFVGSFATFMAVALVSSLARRAISIADGPLLRRVAGEDAAGFRSATHAISNLGLSVGFAASGIAIQLGTAAAYHVLIVIDGLTFLGAWLMMRKLPHYEPLPMPAAERRWSVLRDRPFAAFSVLAAALILQFSVLLVLFPVWVVEETNAPRWTIPLALVINTILVVLFQARLGGRVRTIRQGGKAWARAGVFFLFSCSVMGFAAGLPAWAGLLLLVAAVILHTFGEIFHLGAVFALSMSLPPAHKQGQYDGFLGLIAGIGGSASPALLLGVFLSMGRTGMVVLGVFFVVTSAMMPAVARWGERTRPTSSDRPDAEASDVLE